METIELTEDERHAIIDREILIAIQRIRDAHWACSLQLVADFLRVDKMYIHRRAASLEQRGLVAGSKNIYGSLHCTEAGIAASSSEAGVVQARASWSPPVGAPMPDPVAPAKPPPNEAPVVIEVHGVEADLDDPRRVTNEDLAAAGFVVLDDDAINALPGTERKRYWGRKGAAIATIIRAREQLLSPADH